MKELTIISGKGGTGKTSITASLASLAPKRVVVDADVDAANLFLTLKHDTLERQPFTGGRLAEIDLETCTGCGDCRDRCQFGAVSERFEIDPIACEGCGVCVHFCPAGAIAFEQQVCGQWFYSETSNGPMIHARLGIAQENSGKLVSLLRKEARERATADSIPLILTDGPPGIGCPVIASVTNSDAVLIVTEPSLSGMHDMERVKGLTDQMRVPALICINKADLNPEQTALMKAYADRNGILFAGEIPFDRDVVASMKSGISLVDFSEGPAAEAVRGVWDTICKFLAGTQDRLM